MPAPPLPPTLTLPSPDVRVCNCPHCGTALKLEPVWFQKLFLMLERTNKNTQDINDIQGVI